MPNRTVVRVLLIVGLLAAGWGAWHLGNGFVLRRLAMPDAEPTPRSPAPPAPAPPIAGADAGSIVDAAPRRARTGRGLVVTGRVRDAAGKGAGGARVGALLFGGRLAQDEAVLGSATADGTGTYRLTVTDLPELSRLEDVWIAAEIVGPPKLRGLARVDAGSSTAPDGSIGVDLTLVPTGTVVAHVVTQDGASVPDASVEWRDFDPEHGRAPRLTRCDATGTARLEGVGRMVEVRPVAPGFEAVAEPYATAPPGGVAERTLAMVAVPGRLELIVRDEHLRTLPDAEVVVERGALGRGERRRAVSDADGRVRLEGFRVGEVLRLASAGAPEGLADPTLGRAADGSGGPAASEWTIPLSAVAAGEVFVRRAARARGRLRMASGRPVGAGAGVEISGQRGAVTDLLGEFESPLAFMPGEHTLTVDFAPPRVVTLRAGPNDLDLVVPDAFLLRLRPIWADTKRPVFQGTRSDPMTLQIAAEVHFGDQTPLGVLRYEPATGTMAGWVPLDEGALRVGLFLARTPPVPLADRSIGRHPSPGESLEVELSIALGGFGRVTARIGTGDAASTPGPMDARLLPREPDSPRPRRYARVGESGQLDLDFVDPGTYILDVAAFPTSGRWEVTVEPGKSTDLGVLSLPAR